jgi:hypothetical protein
MGGSTRVKAGKRTSFNISELRHDPVFLHAARAGGFLNPTGLLPASYKKKRIV